LTVGWWLVLSRKIRFTRSLHVHRVTRAHSENARHATNNTKLTRGLGPSRPEQSPCEVCEQSMQVPTESGKKLLT
ncbi:hypothetical protein SFRURICE_010116, partial [Spodoptera frugiperda]